MVNDSLSTSSVKRRGGSGLSVSNQPALSSWAAAHLLLRGLRGEDFVQLEAHGLALAGEVKDGVVLRVEAQHGFGVGGVLLLLADWPHAAEDADVAFCETDERGAWFVFVIFPPLTAVKMRWC